MGLFSKKPKKLAIVFGGGATRGLAHIGVIKALEENGIEFDYVAGTSVGSLIGAFYSAGFTSAQMEEMAKGLKAKDIKKNLIPFTPSKTDGIKKLITTYIGDIDVSELKKHFCGVGVDVKTGNEIHFLNGNLANVVAGSCAVPGVFYPVEEGEYLLYDGGLMNNIPSNVPKIEWDCDAVLAVDVNSTRGQGTQSEKILDTIMASIQIMMKSNSLKGYLHGDLVIQPDLKRFKSTKLDFVDEMIAEGYNATIYNMDKIKMLLNGKLKKHLKKEMKQKRKMEKQINE